MRNDSIQALRAIACLLVLIQHTTYFACISKGLNYQDYLPVDFGTIGVGLFFVISGYVMGKCLDQGPRFLWNRALRIYPPFWIAIALSAVLLWKANTGWTFDLWSAFLLPSDQMNNSYRIPYWTLCYEMAFYAAVYVFILLKLSRLQIAAACLLWIGAIMVVTTPIYPAFVAQPGWWILVSPVSWLFALGLLVSVTIGKWLEEAVTMPVPRFVKKMGDYSYGAYLIHMAIIVGLAAQIDATAISFPMLWLLFGVAGVLGGLLFGWFEHMLHSRHLKRLPVFSVRQRDRLLSP